MGQIFCGKRGAEEAAIGECYEIHKSTFFMLGLTTGDEYLKMGNELQETVSEIKQQVELYSNQYAKK